MKKIIFLLIALNYSTAIAQEKFNSYDDYILKNATYIFEGIVIERKSITDEKLKIVFNITKIQIINIFRNENEIIKNGTVLIVEKDETKQIIENGTILIIPPSHYNPVTIMNNGIYFCNHSDILPSSIQNNADNTFVLTVKLAISFDDIDGIKAFGKVFKTKEEFYKFLSQYPNITIPKEEGKKEEE